MRRVGLPIFGISLLLMGASSPALAGGEYPINSAGGGAPATSVGVSAVAPNQASNALTSTGVVNQSPNGGIFHNNNYSSSGGNVIGVGTGYVCRGGQLEFFGGGTRADSGGFSSNGLSVGVALNIPLKNAADRACEGVAKEHLKHKQIDTAFTLVDKCRDLLLKGLRVDTTRPEFTHLQACESVTLVTQQVPAQPAPAPILPPSKPIRGLW